MGGRLRFYLLNGFSKFDWEMGLGEFGKNNSLQRILTLVLVITQSKVLGVSGVGELALGVQPDRMRMEGAKNNK